VLHGTLALELIAQAYARFDGKRVRELGLPPGCLLTTLRHSIHESVPTADARLEAGDRIATVIAPESVRHAR
jgi:chloride channel protein, CIC family